MWIVAVGSVVGICLTVLGTVYVARRTNSGRVDNSPAAELWSTMRSELARVQTRLSEVEGRLAKAEADLNASRAEVLALQAEAATLRRQSEGLEERLAEAEDCFDEVARLRAELPAPRPRVARATPAKRP